MYYIFLIEEKGEGRDQGYNTTLLKLKKCYAKRWVIERTNS
ncbi:MAG TPA: hypothetical protein VIY08_08700 [Candidatus Nitrosocosmicus sp.]